MSKTIVEFKDVVKTYGSGDALLYAVNHIDFKIEEGEFVVMVPVNRQYLIFQAVWDSLVVEIDGLLYNGTINCMFDTDSFPGIV